MRRLLDSISHARTDAAIGLGIIGFVLGIGAVWALEVAGIADLFDLVG